MIASCGCSAQKKSVVWQLQNCPESRFRAGLNLNQPAPTWLAEPCAHLAPTSAQLRPTDSTCVSHLFFGLAGGSCWAMFPMLGPTWCEAAAKRGQLAPCQAQLNVRPSTAKFGPSRLRLGPSRPCSTCIASYHTPQLRKAVPHPYNFNAGFQHRAFHIIGVRAALVAERPEYSTILIDYIWMNWVWPRPLCHDPKLAQSSSWIDAKFRTFGRGNLCLEVGGKHWRPSLWKWRGQRGH